GLASVVVGGDRDGGVSCGDLRRSARRRGDHRRVLARAGGDRDRQHGGGGAVAGGASVAVGRVAAAVELQRRHIRRGGERERKAERAACEALRRRLVQFAEVERD